VHALATARIRSAQFHLESLLTEHGSAILREMLISVLADSHDPQVSVPFRRVRTRHVP
jgi:hypothetical protein